jgi:hypothetical protein
LCLWYNIWDAEGDDRANHTVRRQYKTSTHDGAPSSPTTFGLHAQSLCQKDEARSKRKITFEGELLAVTDLLDF